MIDEIEIEEIQSEEEDVVLFIEYKYCTLCHIEQPLRTKHCKTCDAYVSKHDHHCPWIGNCVGERNRLWFFWFLQFQFFQLITGLSICSQVVIMRHSVDLQLSESNQLLMLFLTMICISFTLFVLPLVCFHKYLVFINLTSWENLSWMRIWPKRYGSLFSKGIIKTCKKYLMISL